MTFIPTVGNAIPVMSLIAMVYRVYAHCANRKSFVVFYLCGRHWLVQAIEVLECW
jgi:hypothetical protein